MAIWSVLRQNLTRLPADARSISAHSAGSIQGQPNVAIGTPGVGRLMRQNGIQVVRTRKFKTTTDSDHAFNVAPNLLLQDFTASGPNQIWAGDITYVWTREV